ncbi:Acg family FMN-binding oxidoreductase [Streptomyces pratensis]|uniref:Acg family FMN-binding oxidoreductase n=1 Tax=Streptomyces pratensis TaxID=1169025 RepID=UPI00301663E5
MSHRTVDDTAVDSMAADATAAPSMHNAQPWRLTYSRGAGMFTLRADHDRTMPAADPTTRALHIGCGAALFNLRVSAAHLGLSPSTALLPVPSDPALLAHVHLHGTTGGGPGGAPGPPRTAADTGLRELHGAIRERHTSRYPFDDDLPVPPEVRGLLGEAARLEGAHFSFLSATHLETVRDLVRDAEGYDRGDPAREGEQRHWTRNTHHEAPVDGVPDYAFGPADASGRAVNRDFAGTTPVPGRARVLFEDRPQLAVLSTTADRPAAWLRAGQALERVLLTATLHGVASSFLTQPLEWDDLRWLLREPVLGKGHAQMVLRLGYGPAGPRTPRRPVRDILTITP